MSQAPTIAATSSRLIATIPHDLRIAPYRQILAHVEDRLRVRLDHATMRRTQYSVGARTDRDTWVRIEARSPERTGAQGWGGVEAAGMLTGIAKPEWYQAMTWREPGTGVYWRADETELVIDSPVWLAGGLPAEPDLAKAWWARLRRSLKALSQQDTTRPARLDAQILSHAYLCSLIDSATLAAGVPPVRGIRFEWAPAHAELTWANLTVPECWLLGWENWGMAPRGFDAATLLVDSLAVPSVAARVRREFAADLSGLSGRLAILALCGRLVGSVSATGLRRELAIDEIYRQLKSWKIAGRRDQAGISV